MQFKLYPLTSKPVNKAPVHKVTAIKPVKLTFSQACRNLQADQVLFRPNENNIKLTQLSVNVRTGMPDRVNMTAHTQIDQTKNGVWCWYTTTARIRAIPAASAPSERA